MKKTFRPKGFGGKPSSGRPSSSRSSSSGAKHSPAHSQKQSVAAKKFDSPNKDAKLAYPRDWRQVAGTHAIKELIATRAKSIQLLILQQGWKSNLELREIADLVASRNIKIEEKSEPQLFQLCHSHQGAVALTNETPEFDIDNTTWNDHSLVVALDGVEDPHNLGAVMRTSWLMGVGGIIIPEDRAVGITSTVCKVACGGVEHVPVYKSNQFQQPFETLKEAGFWVYGLSHKAKKSIYDIKFPEKVIWVLGAEDKGLRTTTEKVCDELVSIPQVSAEASYNVSVSAALALAETKRQWQLKK